MFYLIYLDKQILQLSNARKQFQSFKTSGKSFSHFIILCSTIIKAYTLWLATIGRLKVILIVEIFTSVYKYKGGTLLRSKIYF